MSITTTELMEGVKLHKIDTKKYKTKLFLQGEKKDTSFTF